MKLNMNLFSAVCMKNLYYYFGLFSCCLYILACHQSLRAQNPHCGYQFIMEKRDSLTFPPMSQVNFQINKFIKESGNHFNYRSNSVIPVVVHIVWRSAEENISDERVISQIEAMNKDFNSENEDLKDAPDEFRRFVAHDGIQFCLAAEDPQGLPVSGIIRRKTEIASIGIKDELYSTSMSGSDAWDPYRYFNIWVANTGELLTGYGTLPNQVSPEKDGIVVHPKYFGKNQSRRFNLGRVAVHETGHFFGLYHTWGDDEDCSTDDGIEDTPLQLHAYTGCPAYPQFSCESSNMFMNFMDYVDDDCMVMFTQGQMDRMLATLELFRSGLIESEISCVQFPMQEPDLLFLVYPNPSDGDITINFMGMIGEVGTIEIYNSIGQRIYQEKTVLHNQMKIALPEMFSGIYWVKIGGRSGKILVLNQ